uniref:Ubiquitinyl hydrolase 1 n=1 Tax=Caenorhabditis tropicalis TaxID=1561998 RepID=A0A1I7T271_9PELO
MPTMVMSQPPKNSGENSQRKRPKSKTDRILAINYMFVGQPEKQYMFYVRERMVYRSNVEVTFDDVFNYLASTTGDETVSLHYSVNGFYVPITTTGQLHTFLHHVHKDQSALLYVENQEYVWNVAPQDKSHKMEKRIHTAPPDGAAETCDSIDEEERHCEHGGLDSDLDDTQDDEEYEDEEEDYDDTVPQFPPILTDDSAPTVCAQKIPVKEAFVDPKPLSGTKCETIYSGGQQSKRLSNRSTCQNEKCEGANRSTKEAVQNKKWTAQDAYTEIKDMLTDALANKKMGSAPERISERLVQNVWNPSFPHNDQVFKDTVSLLKNSIGTGILCYYHQVMSRFNPEKKNGDSIEKIMLSEIMPDHEPEFLANFIDSALVAACDMLESVQHLAHLQCEFDYFNKLYEISETKGKPKQNEKDPLPTLQDVHEHVKDAVRAAHIGFNILNPLFSSGCECHEAINVVTMELQKLLLVLEHENQKTGPPQKIVDTKAFIIESAHKIIKRFTEKECPQHRTIELALRSSEVFKWRSDINAGYDHWIKLRENGQNFLNIPLRCYDSPIERTEPYALIPGRPTGDPDSIQLADQIENSHEKPLTLPSTFETTKTELETVADAVHGMSIEEEKPDVSTSSKSGTQKEAPVDIKSSTANVAGTTTVSTGQTSGGAAAIMSKKMSAELQKMVDNMYKSVPVQHNYVYPPPPKPGAILIPTGGLARCRCSKNCTEFLMEPAYEYVERFNEPRQTVWEKTKQKRFKKN